MSVCGNCRSKLCSCQFQGDGSTTEVVGLGISYAPFQVRPTTPTYRPVGEAHRFTQQTITLNTDVAMIFEESSIPISSTIDMWKITNPTRLTAPINGLYLVGGYIGVTFGSGDNLRVWISKNGASTTPQVKRSNTIQNGGDNLYISVMTLIRLVANDYIELYGRLNSTRPTLLTAGSATPGADIEAGPRFWANWMGE